MTKYEIANEFIKKFVNENNGILCESVEPVYFSIKGKDITVSKMPWAMENSEHAIVVFLYSYKIITRNDCSMIALFFNSNKEVEEYIQLEGWNMRFSRPITTGRRCDYMSCYVSNDRFKAEIAVHVWRIKEELIIIWRLFCDLHGCRSDIEFDYVCGIYKMIYKLNFIKIFVCNTNEGKQ